MSESLTSNVIMVQFSIAVPKLTIQMNKRYKFLLLLLDTSDPTGATLCGHSIRIYWLNILSLASSCELISYLIL